VSSWSLIRLVWRARLKLLYVAVAVAVALVVVWLYFPRQPLVSTSQVDNIRLGMSLLEVEAVFGVPPGDYCTAPVMSLGEDGKQPTVLQQPGAEEEAKAMQIACCQYNRGPVRNGRRWWIGNCGACEVVLDTWGRVEQKSFFPLCPVPPISGLAVMLRPIGL